MDKDFPTPLYDHDKEKYDAACRWLGYTPLTFGKKPLPEFLYQNITCDMVLGKHGLAYSKDQAIASTIATAKQLNFLKIPDVADFPADTYELYLKHLYRGILAACKNGFDKTPAYFTIEEQTSSNEMVGIVNAQDDRPVLLLSLKVIETLKALEKFQRSGTEQTGKIIHSAIMSSVEEDGYMMECIAHYWNNHIQDVGKPGFEDSVSRFAEEKTGEYIRRQIEIN